MRRIIGDFARWRVQARAADHIELAETVLDELAGTGAGRRVRRRMRRDGLENLKELVSALNEFQSLGGFLEHISLVMDRDNNTAGEMVSLMTLHAAKGLEFNNVFCRAEEEVFPNRRSVDDGGVALEEERRLAYVGLTRARRRVWICHASSRRVYNQWLACAPSRSIDELPEDLVEHQMEAGLHGVVAESGLEVLEETAETAVRAVDQFWRMRDNKGASRVPFGGEVSTVNSIATGVRYSSGNLATAP